MGIFSKIKSKASTFLGRQNGKISKRSILTVGAMVGTAAVSSVLLSKKSTAASVQAWIEYPEGEGAPVRIRGVYA